MAENVQPTLQQRGSKKSLEEKENEHIFKSGVDEPEKKGDVTDMKIPDCAICLQSYSHPARIPCGHVFCFLCLKGAARNNRRCAMCRAPIPTDYFFNPDLVDESSETPESDEERYQWFYESRHGGWWQYEERMSLEIEEALKNGITRLDTIICGWWKYDCKTNEEIEKAYAASLCSIELLIVGDLYIIDLRNMSQSKKWSPIHRRKIKRDLSTALNLGIAGIWKSGFNRSIPVIGVHQRRKLPWSPIEHRHAVIHRPMNAWWRRNHMPHNYSSSEEDDYYFDEYHTTSQDYDNGYD